MFRAALWSRIEALVDRRLGVDTREKEAVADLEFDVSEGGPYEPTSWLNLVYLRMLLRRLQISEDDVLIDFGSGKGRVLVVAAQYPFRAVIGIELSARLHKIAERNIARNRHRFTSKDVRLVNADASLYIIPDDVTVAHFNNPFAGSVLTAVVDNLLTSLTRNPRTLRIIYYHPQRSLLHEDVTRCGFRLVHRVRQLYIYSNSPMP